MTRAIGGFSYRDGRLHAEGVAVADIADAHGTPAYVYSAGALRANLKAYQEAFQDRRALIAFAAKANANLAVLKVLIDAGAGIDAVSEGEIRRALAAGAASERIVFAGVGKTPEELAFATAIGVKAINVESEPELEALSAVAEAMGRTAPIALRVNPDVAAGGHPGITTGGAGAKFGVSFDRARDLYRKAAALPGLRPIGLHVHIGSQIMELSPFERAYRRIADLARTLRAEGHEVSLLDLGGGLGVDYDGSARPPTHRDYAQIVDAAIGGLDVDLVFEPGRSIAADAGALLARVLYVKIERDHRFLVLDAAMNDLMRPALYQAHHDLWLERAPDVAGDHVLADVVGPVCETTDRFASGRRLPACRPGDLVAFMHAGAYGAALASEYNARPLAPEVMVDEDRCALVRARPSFDAMLARDRLPEWLS